MRNLVRVAVLLCQVAVVNAATDPTEVDPDVRAFSTYVSDVSRLNGMFRGVADYCRQFVPALILSQANTAWDQHNGRYIDSVDVAIERFISARVEAERKAEAIAKMKANAQAWFEDARDRSKVLEQVQGADDKQIACSRMLGTMASESFYLKKMFPADDDYWSKNLQP